VNNCTPKPIQDRRADIQSSTVTHHSTWGCSPLAYCWCPWSTGTAFCRNQSAGCGSS